MMVFYSPNLHCHCIRNFSLLFLPLPPRHCMKQENKKITNAKPDFFMFRVNLRAFNLVFETI